MRRLSYQVNAPQPDKLSTSNEQVFLTMYIRKMQRRVRGKKSNDSLCCEFIVVVIMLAVIIILGWPDDDDNGNGNTTQQSNEYHQWQDADTVGLVLILLWIIFMLSVFFIFQNSPYVRMIRYMVIYIPLLFFMASVSFFTEVRHQKNGWHLVPGQYALLALAIAAEVLVFVSFMSYYKLYPWVVGSAWFRSRPGLVTKIWNVGSVTDDNWTMNYRGHNPTRHGWTKCQLDYTCKYEGDVDETTGLPDGLGRWLDDAWEGEMLTGYWKQGEPVAPFSSWNVGTDDAVVAVRVAYFKATDDPYEKVSCCHTIYVI